MDYPETDSEARKLFMDEISFVDQTIRDAQQSLWGFTMRTRHMIPIAEKMDKVGYRAIATVGSQAFTVQVRILGEDPWERIRQLSRLITKTPLRGSYQIGSLSSFDLSTPRDIIGLWIKRSVANGIKSFWICDYQTDMEKFVYFARIAKAEGAEVVPALMYTSSPVHTPEHWARKTRLLAEAKEWVDRIMIEDASGVITPEDTRKLVSTVFKNCDGLPIEFHSHCNSGLAPLCYLEAIKAGVTTLHTAVAPSRTALPCRAIETIVKKCAPPGFSRRSTRMPWRRCPTISGRWPEREGLPVGAPLEYDLFHFEHQVPGGMMTNLTRQLREVGMEDRLTEILEEVVLVRKEFGYPVMATPYSQIVGAQAVENVISGKRYKQLTDEAIKYVLGFYGEPAVPVDPKVGDRVMSLPKEGGSSIGNPKGTRSPLRSSGSEIGPDLSDDELLLKILIPGGRAARQEAQEQKAEAPVPHAPMPAGPPRFPSAFSVDVDGEVFIVRISPAWDGAGSIRRRRKGARPPGTALRVEDPRGRSSAGWRGSCFPSR